MRHLGILNTTARRKQSAVSMAAAFCVLATAGVASAQTFNSGSTGADGAFDLTGVPSGTTINFDPKTEPRLVGKDPEGDFVYHFTTITIPAGVTVKMSAKWTNGPIYWLATGAVDISGTLDLGGETGHPYSRTPGDRRVSIPGPGGFPGGLGGRSDTPGWAAQPGAGPGGGLLGSGETPAGRGGGAKQTGNDFLVPLIGGSGGGGGASSTTDFWGSGGGAGGGAITIASSLSIALSGQIDTVGGASGVGNGSACNSFYGGSGSGGAIRLVAPLISGGGNLNTGALLPNGNVLDRNGNFPNCGDGFFPNGAQGRVRLEAFQRNWSFSGSPYITGGPVSSYAPTTPPPSVRVTGVAGQSVQSASDGSFNPADVTINSNDPVEVTIQAHNVPIGTAPKLYLFSLDGNDQVVAGSALQGTLQSSTSTASVQFPPGFSRGYVRAVWTPTP
jgi:hypothetical protein